MKKQTSTTHLKSSKKPIAIKIPPTMEESSFEKFGVKFIAFCEKYRKHRPYPDKPLLFACIIPGSNIVNSGGIRFNKNDFEKLDKYTGNNLILFYICEGKPVIKTKKIDFVEDNNLFEALISIYTPRDSSIQLLQNTNKAISEIFNLNQKKDSISIVIFQVSDNKVYGSTLIKFRPTKVEYLQDIIDLLDPVITALAKIEYRDNLKEIFKQVEISVSTVRTNKILKRISYGALKFIGGIVIGDFFDFVDYF